MQKPITFCSNTPDSASGEGREGKSLKFLATPLQDRLMSTMAARGPDRPPDSFISGPPKSLGKNNFSYMSG